MPFEDFRREREIRRVRRGLARQRVRLVLKPGNVLVIEKALDTSGEGVQAALHTAEIRGWVEILEDAVPAAKLGPQGQLPTEWERRAPIYRLTGAGWNAIHRTQGWLHSSCRRQLFSSHSPR
jgi:hypothetical protein